MEPSLSSASDQEQLLKTKFCARLRELLDLGQIKELAEYGADHMAPAGMVYDSQTEKLYQEFRAEIWNALYYAAIDAGHCERRPNGDLLWVNVTAFIATLGSPERGGSGAWLATSGRGFNRLLVSWLAEVTAQAILSNIEATYSKIEAAYYHLNDRRT